MTASFGIGLGAMALLLTGSLALILRPLAAALHELCGTKDRGDFWTTFCAVAFAAGSLLLGLLGFWFGHADHSGTPPLPAEREAPIWSAIQMVRWTGAGLLLGLFAVAAVVMRFTARLSRGAACPPAPRWEE